MSKFPKEGFTDSSDYETILTYLKEFTDEKVFWLNNLLDK